MSATAGSKASATGSCAASSRACARSAPRKSSRTGSRPAHKAGAKPVVLVVFGTRPEVIKLAPVLQVLRASSDLAVSICATAQHRQMLDRMLENFELRPDHDLDLMRADQDLNAFSSRALPRLQGVIRRVRPDFVLVQGDTTTAFVTALAAFYERVPVGHVEAGLRSYDRANPFPEEANRVMISRLTDLHFAPTEIA